MTEATTENDDGTDFNVADDASEKARIEAERIANAVNYNIRVHSKDYQDRNRISVYWNDGDANEFRKGSIITSVFESDASVELQSTRDGETAVTFAPK